MDSEYKPTFFDSQLQNHQLQIMKTMIPYLSAGQQPFSPGADVSDAYRYQRTVYTRRERKY